MPITYTNRKGQTYTLYKGQTKTGKPRYYFGRMNQSQGEPAMELPPGFTISESVNGVVSLVKDRPSLILPEELAEIVAAVKQHPEARQYRIAVKHGHIEIYEHIGLNFDVLASSFQMAFRLDPDLASRMQSEEDHYAHYAPVLRFTLLDPVRRRFGAKRMCYRGGSDDWRELRQTGSVAELARALIPTLSTAQFFDLW